MEANQSIFYDVEELTDSSSDESVIETSSTTSINENLNNNIGNIQRDENSSVHDPGEQNNVQNNPPAQHNTADDQSIIQVVNTTTNNEPVLLKIDQINTEINFVWKIHGVVSYKHPKRTYTNANGLGEISTWDIVDESASINLVAFNLNSQLISNKLIEGKSFEINGLSIRTADVAYKTLPHAYQLIVTNTTNVRPIEIAFKYQLTYDLTHLNEIEGLPLNSIIDVEVQVLRDYGITAGNTNSNAWTRRELHVHQDGISIRMTLWNDQARKVQTSMVNMRLKIKNIKISWFNGSRTLVTIGNSRLTII